MLTLIKTRGPQAWTFMAQEVIKLKSIPSAGEPVSLSAGARKVSSLFTRLQVSGRHILAGSCSGICGDGQQISVTQSEQEEPNMGF